MTSIQRYDAWPQDWPFEADDGDLVTYEDHRKIVEVLEAERGVLAEQLVATKEKLARAVYVLGGVRGAIKTGRNEPLMIWADQIDIALAAIEETPHD